MALTDRLVRPPVLAAVLAFVAIAPVAAGQGGYFPVAWGWMGLAYAWVGATALVLRREIRLSRAEIVMATGGLLMVLWTVTTLLWTSNTTSTMLVAEHVLAYLAFVAALLVVCERGSAIGLLVGTWAAITTVALYSLATHLGPAVFGFYRDPLQPGRLFQPVGYWNALGIFCAIGIALALGLVDRHGPVVLRALAAASIAPLAATTYFTFSRGSWIALTARRGVGHHVQPNTAAIPRYRATGAAAPCARGGIRRVPARTDRRPASAIPDRRRGFARRGRDRRSRCGICSHRRRPGPRPVAYRRATPCSPGLRGCGHRRHARRRARRYLPLRLTGNARPPALPVADGSASRGRADIEPQQSPPERVAQRPPIPMARGPRPIRSSSNRRGRSGHIPRLLVGAPPVAHLRRQRAQPVP